MYFDWTYVVFVLPMVILSLIAQVKVKSTYTKYSRILSRRGLTAEQAARMILDRTSTREQIPYRSPTAFTETPRSRQSALPHTNRVMPCSMLRDTLR